MVNENNLNIMWTTVDIPVLMFPQNPFFSIRQFWCCSATLCLAASVFFVFDLLWHDN